MGDDLVTADDVRESVEAVCAMAASAADDSDRWDAPAGRLEWSCRTTLAHVADCLSWYAANLARRSSGNVVTPDVPVSWRPAKLIDAVRSGGALLAAAVTAAGAEDRGWHPFGVADRSGFAAMGCDELLVHGADLAAGLGRDDAPLDYRPPSEVCGRVVRRLFPWVTPAADPVATLWWANGRTSLPGRPDVPPGWVWHCAPLAEWDGGDPRAGVTTS